MTKNGSFQLVLLVAFVVHCCQQQSGITTSALSSGSAAAAGASTNRQQQCIIDCIDCAIVGGGPAGLATAIAISNSSPSSSIAIFERDGFQPKGASIQISKSGWKSIAELDSIGGRGGSSNSDGGSLKTKLEETGVEVTAVELKSWTKKKEEDDDEVGRLKNVVKTILSKLKSKVTRILFSAVMNRVHLWHDIRVVLCEHANKLYHRGSSYNNVVTDDDGDEDGDGDGSKSSLVNMNLNLENIKPLLSPEEHHIDEARFELSFKNAETGEVRKVRAKYIFACDGVKSQVRSILPNEPDILLAEDKSVWRGLAPNIYTSGKATFYRGSASSDDDSNNTSGRSGLIFPAGKNAGSSWTVISDVEDKRSTSEEESRKRVLKVIESMGTDNNDDYKLFKQVIDDSAIIIENKLHVRDFDKPWESSYDGLIYLGDSAHPVRPSGEGTALAFEDANVLGKVISKLGLGVEALREYENQRYEPVKAISEKVRAAAQNYYKTNTKVVTAMVLALSISS
jgi:2-polyprenyl-6-methoxyphenol hydroxylase-like FAD-dependent oxidoreductase